MNPYPDRAKVVVNVANNIGFVNHMLGGKTLLILCPKSEFPVGQINDGQAPELDKLWISILAGHASKRQ